MKQDIIHTSQTTWGVEGGKIDGNFTEIYSSILANHALLVKKIGDTCAILANYNSTYNLLIRFKYCLANHIYTFSEVGLLAKSKNRLLENIDIQLDTVIQSQLVSDCIGPIIMNYGWCGGNHLFSDGTTKTANSEYYKISINDVEISDNILYETDELIVETKNNIYNYSLLPSVQDAILNETVVYRIKKTNIEVFVEHAFVKNAVVSTYYGMQANDFSNTWQKKIYAAHSNSDLLQDFVANMNFGAVSLYPNLEKVISCNDDKTICLSMFLNNVGLSESRTSRMDDGKQVFFVSDLKKQYYTLINKAESKIAGDSYFWSGCYSFFDNSENESGVLFNHEICIGGRLVKSMDIQNSGSFDIKLAEDFGKKISIIKKDNTISLPGDIFFNNKLIAIDFGNIYFSFNN